MALPPVARMVATPSWFIRALVASIEGWVIHCTQFSGAPAAIAASRTIRAAWADDSWADGWKAKDDEGFRVFKGNQCFKDCCWSRVGCRVIPQTTPTGLQSELNEWRHLLKWHQLSWCDVCCSQRVHKRISFLLPCLQRPHDQFLHKHEEQAHRVRQEQLQMLSLQCSPLAPGSFAHFFKRHQRFFAPTRLRVFQQRVSFLQVRVFISHLMLSSNVWNPYPF